MPREGTQYWVDDLWRERVQERLQEKRWKPADLARESGCPPSMLSELLNGKRTKTTYLPEIHEALDWPAPLGPLLSRDDEELLSIASKLTSEQRAALRERALVLQEERKKK
jgi:transcriptional regulator with XRE-family HTH domain